jgi:ribosomal protein L7/L12
MAEQTGGLPGEAIAALARGNKIEAIKILRTAENMGLKEAKDRVEEYLRNDPVLQQKLAATQAESRGTLLRWLVILALLVSAGYYFLVPH